MSANPNVAIARAESTALADMSDAELLTRTRSLVGRSNRLLAELLAHLGEVEARGVHRTRACSSLYTYCIYELRFSEDEAFRRVAAARLVRRFPALLDAVAAGELHLTGLLMLGPHLTSENLVQVIARAKHRTKREIARLVRVLDPLPPVPARIEPLGPAPARLVPPEPTWGQFIGAMNPVRELAAGERPRDWGPSDEKLDDSEVGLELKTEVCEEGDGIGDDPTNLEDVQTHGLAQVEGTASRSDAIGCEALESHAPARLDAEPPAESLAPQRYKVQFTATEEYVRLVDEAKALLSHAGPRATLEDVQLRAMRSFVGALRKRKYGTSTPAAGAAVHANAGECAASLPVGMDGGTPRGTGDEAPSSSSSGAAPPSEPRQRGRYVPAAVRRAVAERDGCSCTYVDASGERCAETRLLEFHHVVPFAVAPSHDVENVTLRCAAHNALAAEQDFGRGLIQQRRSAARYDGLSEQMDRAPRPR